MKKKLLAILAVLLLLWLAVFATDYCLINRGGEPIFVLRTVSADDGGSYVGRGLGYTVTVKKYFTPDTPLTTESVTMTVCGHVVVAWIT